MSEATTVSFPLVGDKPLFITSWYCPYVQRAWVALNLRKADYQRCEIDLRNKPEWFVKVSPTGKVPCVLLKKGDDMVTLYESMILMQYADEIGTAGDSLTPSDPVDRALMRIALQRADNLVGSFYKLLFALEVGPAQEAAKNLTQELTLLESQLHEEGPYAKGAHATLLDCAIYPWLRRAHVLQHYRGYDVFEGHPKLQRVYAALQSLPAVKDTEQAPHGMDFMEGLTQTYLDYGKRVFLDWKQV